MEGGKRAFVWLGLWLASAELARAEPSGLALNWTRLEGAEQCMSASELMERLESHYGRILFVRTRDAPLSIDGYVRRLDQPPGFSVMLEISEASGRVLGRRELGPLPGDDCHVIDAAVLLAVPSLLSPDGLLEQAATLSPAVRDWLTSLFAEDPELSAAATPAPALEVHEATPAAAPLPAARATPREPGVIRGIMFDASAEAALGQLPGLAFGGLLHASLSLRSGVSFELGFGFMPDRTQRSDFGRVGFGLAQALLALCLDASRIFLSFCAGGEYQRLSATPQGFRQNAEPSQRGRFELLAQTVLRLELSGPLYLRGALALSLPFERDDYRFETAAGLQRLYRTSVVAGRAELGLGYRF